MSDWWQRAFSGRSGEPSGDLVADLEAACKGRRRVDLILDRICAKVEAEPGYLTAERLETVAACLAQEWPGRTMRFLHFDSATGYDLAVMGLVQYRRLVELSGIAALDSMRWLLGRAAAAARWCTDEADWLAMGYRREACADGLLGPKAIALAALLRHGDESDLARLRAIVTNPAEDTRLRLAAWLGQSGLCAPPEVLEHHLSVVLTFAQPKEIAQSGTPLIEPLIGRFDLVDNTIRRRAVEVLPWFGTAAVPALVRTIVETSSDLVLQSAERALEAISTEQLAEARAARQAAVLGLSRAAPPAAEPERGLSRMNSDDE